MAGHAVFATASSGGPAPTSTKRKTLLPRQRKQVVSQVPRFARRLFRERTAFLSTEVGEILLLRVHARNQLDSGTSNTRRPNSQPLWISCGRSTSQMKFHHLALSCRRTSRPTCASILVAPPETRDAVRLQTRSSILREGSRMAGISIKGQLFGISNLKARRYAIDVIDHGAEKPASRNGIPAAFRRSSS